MALLTGRAAVAKTAIAAAVLIAVVAPVAIIAN